MPIDLSGRSCNAMEFDGLSDFELISSLKQSKNK